MKRPTIRTLVQDLLHAPNPKPETQSGIEVYFAIALIRSPNIAFGILCFNSNNEPISSLGASRLRSFNLVQCECWSNFW